MDQGMIYAEFDRETNSYMIVPDDAVNGDFYILLSPKLVDFSEPVHFQTPKGNCTKTFEPSEDLMFQFLQESVDPEMVYAAVIAYSDLDGE